MTNYAGIDYSRGMRNVNLKTRIHYGVINQNEVLQVWFDSNEPQYIFYCPHCGEPLESSEVKKCKSCKKKIAFDTEFDMIEPCAYTYTSEGYKCEQSADNTDIFITDSPYYTYAQYCSPCAPGAGYLMNWYDPSSKDEKQAHEQLTLINTIAPLAYGEAYKSYAEQAGFPKVYCFGHDWFEDGKAPYPVFSVATGELIKA